MKESLVQTKTWSLTVFPLENSANYYGWLITADTTTLSTDTNIDAQLIFLNKFTWMHLASINIQKNI